MCQYTNGANNILVLKKAESGAIGELFIATKRDSMLLVHFCFLGPTNSHGNEGKGHGL